MVRKPDIQYVHQFYVYGSEARAPELKPVRKKQKEVLLPKPKTERNIFVAVDPASLCGIVIACVMMTMMTIGVFRLSDVYQQNLQMESYLIALQNENVDLEKVYRSGYDLADVQEKALAIGLVPVRQVQTIPIHVEIPQPEPEPTLWENICWYFQELFA